ncbi:MAG: HD domain-containing phosphohydrolase [Candidatus Hydrogenedentota bacterium]
MLHSHVVVMTGPLQGRTVPLTGSLSIGRSPENDLQLNDLQVSRHHALVRQRESGVYVQDLDSGNGVYVNERRITEAKLNDGDVIAVGPVQLRYVSLAGAQPPDAPSNVRFMSNPGGEIQAEAASNVFDTFFQRAEQEALEDDNGECTAIQARLAAVYRANQIIASEQDLGRLFARVLHQIFALTPAHNGGILLQRGDSGELVTEYARSGEGQDEVRISSTIVERAFRNNEAVITYNAADDSRFGRGASIISHNIASAMCAPLIHQGETLGVIYVDTRGAPNAFSQGDLELLVALAGPAAIAIKNAQYVAQLEQAYHDTLIGLANAIELRDHYTVGHTWRVTNIAIEMARVLGWDEERLRLCQMGGILHDVGKIAIDDAILRKPGPLTEDEFETMKLHPERGARMMRDIDFLLPLIPFTLYHHERYDGTGYPAGLAATDIPIEGRLLAVADAFDAMTSHRPYRSALDPAEAVRRIEEGKGTQFDPQCADAFLKCYREGRIAHILQDYHRGARSIACPFCSTYIPVSKEIAGGDRLTCTVCHRPIRLCERDGVWCGELVSAAGAPQAQAFPKPGD